MTKLTVQRDTIPALIQAARSTLSEVGQAYQRGNGSLWAVRDGSLCGSIRSTYGDIDREFSRIISTLQTTYQVFGDLEEAPPSSGHSGGLGGLLSGLKAFVEPAIEAAQGARKVIEGVLGDLEKDARSLLDKMRSLAETVSHRALETYEALHINVQEVQLEREFAKQYGGLNAMLRNLGAAYQQGGQEALNRMLAQFERLNPESYRKYAEYAEYAPYFVPARQESGKDSLLESIWEHPVEFAENLWKDASSAINQDLLKPAFNEVEEYVEAEVEEAKGFTRFVADKASDIITKPTQNGDFPQIFDIGGFDRDHNGVYHSKQDALLQSQKYIGYNDFYDVVFDWATSMDAKKFIFSVGDQKYIIWLWKGDYLNLGAGSEIGIYYGGGPHWLIDKDLAMPMTLSLYDTESKQTIFEWKPEEKNWWCTGFNPEYQNRNKTVLKARGSIDFSQDLTMWEAFYSTYDKYEDEGLSWDFDPTNHIAYFSW